MNQSSAIYRGEVVHVRHRPKAHTLRYRVFSLLLDLDEIEDLSGRLKMFAYNRWGVFSFRDTDHGDGIKGGLRNWAEGLLAHAGINERDLKIEMLCYPRMFGYVFNPLTVYYCADRAGRMRAILYEVRNTFHERHTYVIPVDQTDGEAGGTVRQSCAKELYVSPFVPMSCTYDFRIAPPAEKVLVAINERDGEGDLLYAAFTGKRSALTDKSLFAALFRYPLMTLKIMAGIHLEALKLWAKGNPVFMHKKAEHRTSFTVVARIQVGDGSITNRHFVPSPVSGTLGV